MYMDAEERKAELMKENKMSSNLMFKMEFDPRIIGKKFCRMGERKLELDRLFVQHHWMNFHIFLTC